MIVDAFAHAYGEADFSPTFLDGFARIGAAATGIPVERALAGTKKRIFVTADDLIKDMDEAGIDKTLITHCDLGMGEKTGETRPVVEANKRYAEMAKAHPDRLISVYGTDPRRPNVIENFERAFEDWGMKGLHVHTGAGFRVNDPCCYPLFYKAQELGAPLYVHDGPTIYPMRGKTCFPYDVDDIAVDFPNLKVILPRAGLQWWWDAIAVASCKPNVYLGLAGWEPRAMGGSVEFYIALRTMLNSVGPYRVLFATDWPLLRGIMGSAQFVKAFTEPPEYLASVGIGFSEDEINCILGDNAARLLGINR